MVGVRLGLRPVSSASGVMLVLTVMIPVIAVIGEPSAEEKRRTHEMPWELVVRPSRMRVRHLRKERPYCRLMIEHLVLNVSAH